jgi:hypothetical protein
MAIKMACSRPQRDHGRAAPARLVTMAIHILASTPHQFCYPSAEPACLLCICAPPGQEESFAAIGDRVAGRTSLPSSRDPADRAARIAGAGAVGPLIEGNYCKMMSATGVPGSVAAVGEAAQPVRRRSFMLGVTGLAQLTIVINGQKM